MELWEGPPSNGWGKNHQLVDVFVGGIFIEADSWKLRRKILRFQGCDLLFANVSPGGRYIKAGCICVWLYIYIYITSHIIHIYIYVFRYHIQKSIQV